MNILSPPVTVRRIFGAALAGGTFLLATGCGHNSIVGKWQGNVPIRGMSLPTTLEFKPDGTDTQTASVQSPIGTVSIVAAGTYVVKDTSLQMTQTSMTMNGRAMPMTAQPAQTVPFKVDGDSLTLTPPNATQAVTLTRVKS